MCSDQLSLFSDDLPEEQSFNDIKEVVKNDSNDKNKDTKKIKEEIINLDNLTEEDKKLQNIREDYSSLDLLSDELRINYSEKIKEVALGCQKCELSKTRVQVVYSSGNINAPIMIIGEGPGENEDLTGIPFVGKAGQLLDKILESGGINRENSVYISNVVKCRPPKNRTPLPEEINACSIYINNQLKLTKAKIILLAGSTATNAFLGQVLSITKVRGNWIEKEGKWIMPIFHPSYLLRNSSKDVGSPKWLMWQDIKKVKNKLQELKDD